MVSYKGLNTSRNCIDGNQILDFDISNWDAEATVPSYIFDQIHNIVNYLNRVFII